MTNTAETKTERDYRVVKNVANGYTVATLTLSAFHLVSLSLDFGGGWQSYLSPALVDGFVILGKLADRPGITRGARRLARTVSIVAGTISFAANITEGIVKAAPALSVIGALAVIGFWTAEYLSHKMRPTTKRPATPRKAAAPAPVAPAKPAVDYAARAAKAAATRAAKKAAATTLTHPAIDALPADTRAYL
jgi:hypothetical protein